jgi:hypothetical protein
MRCSRLSVLLPIFLHPAQALTLKGTAFDREGNSVRVVVRLDRSQPEIVDLDYSPVHVPSNHNALYGSPTTYNGVDGSEYFSLDNQSETVASHLRIFDLKRPGTGAARNEIRGKVARDESTTLRWSGITTSFIPSGGGQAIVTDQESTPQTKLQNYRSRELVTGEIAASSGRALSWSFASTTGASSSASIVTVRIDLRPVNLKKWRIRLSTERQYLDIDYWPSFRTIQRGFLRAR